MPFTDRDLIDSDDPLLFKRRLCIASFEESFLDNFDQIPAGIQVLGYIKNCHISDQLQYIALKGIHI
jgi:hypothetical protein